MIVGLTDDFEKLAILCQEWQKSRSQPPYFNIADACSNWEVREYAWELRRHPCVVEKCENPPSPSLNSTSFGHPHWV